MNAPIIKLENVSKIYGMGKVEVTALRNVQLSIEAGEFVAIMGASGSGKSTLLYMMGLMDTPTLGSYRLYDKEITNMSEDNLAVFRREHIGFIFQQFSLLPRMSALDNTALPSFYSQNAFDYHHARMLLQEVGLGDRLVHKPAELSGGQQQRVAIARALINSPRIILADEPTGNLDSTSKEEIMAILRSLNDQGITLIIVTHEADIGRQAQRIIQMRDGGIQSDKRQAPTQSTLPPAPVQPTPASEKRFRLTEVLVDFKEGLKTFRTNTVRSLLSMLGIMIGVAAVVAMLALGKGAQESIRQQLAFLGSNLLILRPGVARVYGAAPETTLNRLTMEDAALLKASIPGIAAVSPSVSGRGQLAHLNRNWNTRVLGVGTQYPHIQNANPTFGRFFTDDENRKRSRVAVIGTTILDELFEGKNPIGEMIKINRVNFQIIGVLPEKGATAWADQDDVVVVPTETAMDRLFGKTHLDYIDIEVNRPENVEAVEDATIALMLARHDIPASMQGNAFEIRNMADIRQVVSQSTQTMGVLLAVIAAISLIVGGIGIMNIMLISVTERTREIGIRKAVGAKRRDILSQFLAESVVVSGIGGLMGVFLGWLITTSMATLIGWTTAISPLSVLLAFGFSTAVGVIFGIYPARKAALLNPVEALRHD